MTKHFHPFFLLLGLLAAGPARAQQFQLASPNGRLLVTVTVGDSIRWAAALDHAAVVAPSPLALVVEGQALGLRPRLKAHRETTVNQTIVPVVARKFRTEADHYRELLLTFQGHYAVAFRAYDDGVAYRFQTTLKGQVRVNSETARVRFSPGSQVLFPQEDTFVSHNERLYKDTVLAAISGRQMCSLPALVTVKPGVRVLMTDADLFDYPNMYLRGTGRDALTATFPKAVLQRAQVGDRDEKIVQEADYLALTMGTRTFPWRVFTITPDDGHLLESDLVYKLSRPCVLKETDWIHPGQVAWDWWNNSNVYGVDFRAGFNTATYKYYIDFAARYGLRYILLDEGWTQSTTNLAEAAPGLDIEEVIRYGRGKNVDVLLWVLWKPLEKDMALLLDRYAAWGAKGIKVDYLQRSDQQMVNIYERIARECAQRHLLVDFHGSFKPAGLHRAYPNVMGHEGVRGQENNKWETFITPRHNLTLPFIRMVAGPMDYTPGAMNNANQKNFAVVFDAPMSQGTRCHQVAMYVVYEAPLQMLADSPSNYYREPETTAFITRIPTTWDTTRVLQANVAEYVLLARRKDAKWYVGAMTNWTPHDFTLDCRFLGPGTYTLTLMQDGANAERDGRDYQQRKLTVTAASRLPLHLAAGGGWAAIIEKAGP